MKKKWTYDKCYEEAKKYNSRGDYQKYSRTAYNVSYNNKWLDDYTWFERKPKNVPSLTYEQCMNEARKYSTLSAFRNKSPRHFGASYRNKWLNDFDWLRKRAWTYEECFKVARNFNSKREFEIGKSGAYQAARKHGWLKDYSWMQESVSDYENGRSDNVYMYYFEQYNTIYIGRTISPNNRDIQHLFSENSAVYKFAKEHNCKIPKMIIIEKNLTLQQGQIREDYYVKHYKNLGYIILNKGATGLGIGSLGSLAGVIWTREKCLEEARKYTSRNEFKNYQVGAYTRALKNGWLSDYKWFEEPKTGKYKWDYEACLLESKKYSTRSEFQHGCSTAYRKACKNNWIDDFIWLAEPRHGKYKWNYDTCYKEATKFKSKTAFRKALPGAYKKAVKNNWIELYTWFIKPTKEFRIWKEETCYIEAKKYKTRNEFRKAVSGAYKKAKKYGWIENYKWFIDGHKAEGLKRKVWDYDACKKEAQKYPNRNAFLHGSSTRAYRISRDNGWLDEFYSTENEL